MKRHLSYDSLGSVTVELYDKTKKIQK